MIGVFGCDFSIQGGIMRECIKCLQAKEDSEFAQNSEGQLLKICKECMDKVVNGEVKIPTKRKKPPKEEIIETEEERKQREQEEQRLKELQDYWGKLPIYRGVEMTLDVYEELQEFFNDKVAEFKGQTLTKTQETTIKDATKLRVASRHLLARGDEAYAKLIKSSEELLASEQLRKKDERPVENFRIDSQIKALEDAGFIEKGYFLNAKDTAKVISKNFAKKRKYDHSIDVVDDVLLDIINSMRANQDEPLLSDLPDDMLQDDIFGECNPEETEEEKERKKFAGIVSRRDK